MKVCSLPPELGGWGLVVIDVKTGTLWADPDMRADDIVEFVAEGIAGIIPPSITSGNPLGLAEVRRMVQQWLASAPQVDGDTPAVELVQQVVEVWLGGH